MLVTGAGAAKRASTWTPPSVASSGAAAITIEPTLVRPSNGCAATASRSRANEEPSHSPASTAIEVTNSWAAARTSDSVSRGSSLSSPWGGSRRSSARLAARSRCATTASARDGWTAIRLRRRVCKVGSWSHRASNTPMTVNTSYSPTRVGRLAKYFRPGTPWNRSSAATRASARARFRRKRCLGLVNVRVRVDQPEVLVGFVDLPRSVFDTAQIDARNRLVLAAPRHQSNAAESDARRPINVTNGSTPAPDRAQRRPGLRLHRDPKMRLVRPHEMHDRPIHIPTSHRRNQKRVWCTCVH